MAELSIFIDESGKFEDFSSPTKYYIISLIFHEQNNSIEKEIKVLENYLKMNNISPNFYIHSLPIIRNKGYSRFLPIEKRRSLIARLFRLFRRTDIKHISFIIDRKYVSNMKSVCKNLTSQINDFIAKNESYFSNFDVIKVYYDRGQSTVTKIIRNSLMKSLNNAVEKDEIVAKSYRLSQVADLICTLELVNIKDKNNELTKSEKMFFKSEKELRKNYLKPFEKQKFSF